MVGPTSVATSQRHSVEDDEGDGWFITRRGAVHVTTSMKSLQVLVTSLLYASVIITTYRPTTSLLSSSCVHIRPRPHYDFWTCSKFDHLLHAHGDHTTSLSVCTAFLLLCTSSYCVHPIFRRRNGNVAECDGAFSRGNVPNACNIG